MSEIKKPKRGWLKAAFLAVAIAGVAGGAHHMAAPAPVCSFAPPERGDGHPVIVLPGFMTNDFYLASLRGDIAATGYKTYGWKRGFNLGADAQTAAHMRKLLQDVFAQNGGQKITLVGHSLGGLYARELASANPEIVRDVITLGSPLTDAGMNKTLKARMREIHELLNPANAALAVPAVSIYSKNDLIVNWELSVGAATENIEVESGHIMLPFDPKTVAVVLDRLSAPQSPYNPGKFSCGK